MIDQKGRIRAVPTNVITGFLGVGKTSAILHLMQNKPANESWAVLVNEFGEIGVDGSLLQGQQGEQRNVFVSEVPGGCMCCAAGVPMQIALNQLLVKAKPDRLLIEPTGLGHPKEVLQVLSSTHYREVLSLQKTLTLVDARKLSDTRYTSHETFNQQIAIADVVVGNKADLYEQEDKTRLISYVEQLGKSPAQLIFTEQGKIDFSLLQGDAKNALVQTHHHHHEANTTLAADLPMPQSGFIKAENKGEGFASVGWRFAANNIFSYQGLRLFLNGLKNTTPSIERVKAVFITDQGAYGFNFSDNALSEFTINTCEESRIELIYGSISNSTFTEDLESQLLACRLNNRGEES